MFDVSFSELALIGIVALVVIGPERLPKVARTVGHLLGRAQRYVNDVKGDIQREMDLGDLRDLKGQMEEAARSVQTSIKEGAQNLHAPLQEAKEALTEAAQSLHQTATSITAASETLAPPTAALDSPAETPTSVTTPSAASVAAPLVGATEPSSPVTPAVSPVTVSPEPTVPASPQPQENLPGFAEASALAKPVPPTPPSGTPT